MKTTTAAHSHSFAQLLSAVVAVGLTAAQLVAVDALAQQRNLSSHAKLVQLERVVVTGHRATVLPIQAARCDLPMRAVC